MPTRKNQKSKKPNNKFRKTRSKRQTRKSKNKPRSKRQRGGVSRKGGSNPDPDDFRDLFTDPELAKIVAAEKAAEKAEINAINDLLVEAAEKEKEKEKEKERRKRRREEENAELIANMPNKADGNRYFFKPDPCEWDRVDHPGEKWPKTMHRGGGQIKKDKKKV